MDKLLEQLFTSEVLTEEVKQELQAALKKHIDEATTAARAEATATVTAELNEQWISERETLIEALDAKVTEVLTAELAELQEDIERYKDQEAEYAAKLVEAKQELAETMKQDIGTLITELDTWLEIRLTSELEEFREDVSMIKKNEFGRSIYEAFEAEFKKHYTTDDSVESKLSESEQRLSDAMIALEEAERKAAKFERSIKMDKVLSPLSGRTREVMEAILKNVETPLLEESYKTYVGRVLKETSKKEVASEKEAPVLAEGKEAKAVSGVVKTGDNNVQAKEEKALTESEQRQPSLDDAERQRLRKAAGLV